MMKQRTNKHSGTLAIGVAVAMTATGTAWAQSGIIVLDPNGKNALTISGNAGIGLDYIYVNSSHPVSAVYTEGNAEILSPTLDVVGGVSLGGAAYTGTLTTGVSAIADPLAAIPDASWDPSVDYGEMNTGSASVVFVSPGYYSGGANIEGTDTVVFQPGVYILDGIGLRVAGGATLIGDGAVFYITGTGSIEINGGSTVISIPPNNGAFKGVCFFQDRANSNDAYIAGNGAIGISGAIYLPSATLTLEGGSSFGVDVGAIGDLVIVNRLAIAGKGTVTVGDNSFTLPFIASYLMFD